MDQVTWSHTPVRLRFFLGTCWVSLTCGVLLYLLTFAFDYPFHLAIGILVLRAGVQTLRDMSQFRIELTDAGVQGVSVFGSRIFIDADDIHWEKTRVRNGRFFIESQDGRCISARLFWYTSQAQADINRFVYRIRSPTQPVLDT